MIQARKQARLLLRLPCLLRWEVSKRDLLYDASFSVINSPTEQSFPETPLTNDFLNLKFTEIYDLREELKKSAGDKFDLKAFHEKFLGYGSVPVKYIVELMKN